MSEMVASFDSRCRKMPKKLREWEAFQVLRTFEKYHCGVFQALLEVPHFSYYRSQYLELLGLSSFLSNKTNAGAHKGASPLDIVLDTSFSESQTRQLSATP